MWLRQYYSNDLNDPPPYESHVLFSPPLKSKCFIIRVIASKHVQALMMRCSKPKMLGIQTSAVSERAIHNSYQFEQWRPSSQFSEKVVKSDGYYITVPFYLTEEQEQVDIPLFLFLNTSWFSHFIFSHIKLVSRFLLELLYDH